MRLASRTADLLCWLTALAGPAALTAVLARISVPQRRDYVFLYLALVMLLGMARGLWPSLVAAALSFVLVDYFFVPPVGTLTIADEQDIVNLLAFALTAGGVGLLVAQRRRAQLEAEALARQLRQTNTELVRLNKEQAEAAASALALARTREQVRSLQELDRLRRELLANVSHELRTPLGTILAQSTSPLPKSASDEARRLQTIAAEARRLRELVDDMLDMAVIEAGTLELRLEPVRLADAVEAAVERLAQASPGRAAAWDSEQAGVDVLADWDRLGQIFDNLLANADRFGPPGTPIEVSVAPDGPGLVAVRVRDHGPGVPGEERAHIFERFVRGDDADGGRPIGSGLGLSIVRALVEAHAGTVEVEDTAGPGATFRFTLPLAEDSA